MRSRSATLAAMVVLAAALIPACSTTEPRPNRAQRLDRRSTGDTTPRRPVTPRELQLQLQGYVDVASELYRQAAEKILQQTDDQLIRLRARQLSVYPRMSMMQLVSGPDPDLTMLDMVVMATLFRMVVEDHWGPVVFGDLAGPVEGAARRVEQYIWDIADDVLSPAALAELRLLIDEWRARHPDQLFVSGVRFREFAQLRGLDDGPGPGVVSGIFRTVNPLSGLRGTTQELQETRQLAERAMFFVQRMPDLFLSQAQLSLVETLSMPESRELLGGVTTLSAASKSLSRTADALPDRLGAMLEEHEATTRGLLVELRSTLEAGRALTDSAGATVLAADGLAARFDTDPTPGDRTAPEDSVDVEALLTEANRTTTGLNDLVGSLERLLASPAWDERVPQLESTIERVDRSGADLVDRAFRRAAMLVGVILAAALIYRVVSRKLA